MSLKIHLIVYTNSPEQCQTNARTTYSSLWHSPTNQIARVQSPTNKRSLPWSLGKFSCVLTPADFSMNYFRNTIKVINSLAPDQVWHFAWPDLGSNCLQMLSVDDTKSMRGFQKDKFTALWLMQEHLQDRVSFYSRR